ncbi:MAG TPA: endolytic transglycosylase MltG [Gallionellaceae bacterium]|nr:endolytic transglycosylase MltG [Gallionellaceae bacterium]
MRRIKRLLILILLLALSLAGSAAYYATRPLELPSQPFEFSLNQGTSLKGAARQLQQAGLIPSDLAFVWLARALGKSTQIKAGNYELEYAVTTLGLLDMLTKGQVSQGEIGIIEGWTFNEFRTAVKANPGLRHDSAMLSEPEILQRIGAPEAHAEGLFFPDTYYFANGVSDLIIYKRAYQTMQKHLQESWQGRVPGLPLESPYQALTLASIVEKETGQARDRGAIAGVFINRLRKRMKLQTDPSVIYGIGEKFDGNLRKRDLLTDTPFNTYTRTGLPPTPIALPGLASLQAALHPAQTDALYFVSRGDGSSEFSATLVQHNRAVDRYQK